MKNSKRLVSGLSDVVSVRDFFAPQSPTCGIQEAMAALGPRGGRVHLPAGTYRLRCPIVLHDDVTLSGDGAATVLTSAPPRFTPLAADARRGQSSILCAEQPPFLPGEEIGILDDEMFMNNGSHARVLEVRGPRVRLDTPIHKTLKRADRARAARFSPAIFAKDRSGFCVQDLTIQGPAHYRGPRCDFTFSAFELLDCRGLRIVNCTVLDWPSDGISIQGGGDAQVTNCQAHRCRGHGLHPGTNLARSVWSHNISTHNGGDGFFFCAGVHHAVCANNVLNFNGRGVGGVGNGGDHHNIISANVIAGNQTLGISATNGEEHLISGNIIMNNSQRSPGRWPGIALWDFRRGIIHGNRLADDQKRKTQTVGIQEKGSSDYNLISGNFCLDMPQPVVLVGRHSAAAGNFTGREHDN